jgi:ABC-type transport system involved in cytochrome bd biosynthesis fused ATPase/permease subunit
MAEMEMNKPVGTSMPVLPGLSPLSETIWKGKANINLIGDVSARLTWKDLTVTVTVGTGDMHTVLDQLTGYAEPGTITTLMGPSGSGKSTLLDALAGRLAANAFLSGTVLLNGQKTKLSFGTAVSFCYLNWLFCCHIN